MNPTHRLLAATLLLVLASPALAQQGGAAKKLYCWDESGRKVCGDALPASAVDSARTEINAKSGLATGRVARAPSAEERAAAAAQAWIDAENAAAAAAAMRRDLAMVESYNNETELRRVFEHRITLLDATVDASQLGVAGLRESLVGLLRRAGETELAGRPVPPVLAERIGGQRQALRRQQALLMQQRLDRESVDQELAAALERYRALKRPALDNG